MQVRFFLFWFWSHHYQGTYSWRTDSKFCLCHGYRVWGLSGSSRLFPQSMTIGPGLWSNLQVRSLRCFTSFPLHVSGASETNQISLPSQARNVRNTVLLAFRFRLVTWRRSGKPPRFLFQFMWSLLPNTWRIQVSATWLPKLSSYLRKGKCRKCGWALTKGRSKKTWKGFLECAYRACYQLRLPRRRDRRARMGSNVPFGLRRVFFTTGVFLLVMLVIWMVDVFKSRKDSKQAASTPSSSHTCSLNGKLYSPGATVRTATGGTIVCREGSWKTEN